jgi:hypothetical protein
LQKSAKLLVAGSVAFHQKHVLQNRRRWHWCHEVVEHNCASDPT